MKEITPLELKQKIDKGEDFQLIDCREPQECEICSIGGELIPMDQIVHKTDSIRKDVPVIIHCRSGKRSGNVIQYLEMKFGFENLYNLKGGILGYADEVDTSLTKY
jgi:sulfur-carrier protein adenylyltransferase/sulfurtransferase